jgi:hypothetical protein
LTVANHKGAFDEDVSKALGILHRVLERGLVDELGGHQRTLGVLGIEDRDIGISTQWGLASLGEVVASASESQP